MAEKTLNGLFLETLKDIYYPEKQILNSLSKMVKRRLPNNSAPRSRNITAKPKDRPSGLSGLVEAEAA